MRTCYASRSFGRLHLYCHLHMYCYQDTWLDVVAPHIQKRIARYSANEIRFNLMAVVGDRQEALSRQLAAVRARRAAAAAKLGLPVSEGASAADGGAAGAEAAAGSSGASEALPEDEAGLQLVLTEAEAEAAR